MDKERIKDLATQIYTDVSYINTQNEDHQSYLIAIENCASEILKELRK